MSLEEMNRELLEEITSLRNQNISMSGKNKDLRKQLILQRELLIDYHMTTLFDQKCEENKKLVESIVDEYLKNMNEKRTL